MHVSFRDCFVDVFKNAGLVIFTAKAIKADAVAYCRAEDLPLKATDVCPLGSSFEPAKVADATALPMGLRPNRYILFVSTIEPRKGHRLLQLIWQRLLKAGIPQAHNFKLVFLGRQGWLVGDLMQDLKSDPAVGDTLIMLSNVDDLLLGRLYADAAFCVFPSLYEGFGLPVVEAFGYGKAVVASNAGALPETVGKFSPIVAAGDEDAWFDILKRWIEDDTERLGFEQLIAAEYRPRSWQDASKEFFDIVDRRLQ